MGAPRQADLDALFARTTRVRVITGGVAEDAPLGDDERLGLDGEQVAALAATLQLGASAEPRCPCPGDWALELLDADDARVATLGLHHGQALRWGGWTEDVALVNPDAVLDLLATSGLDEPRHDALAVRAAAAVARERHARWVAQRPAALAALADNLMDRLGLPRARSHPAWARAAEALVAAEGGVVAAARALLRWLASSDAAWSSYPAEEEIALTVLDVVGPEAIVAATGDDDDHVLIAAAARGLAAGTWSRQQLRDAARPAVARLTRAVADHPAEHRARLAAILWPAPSVVGDGDLVVAGRTVHHAADALAVHHGVVFAGDGVEIVGFDATGRRHVLATLEPGHRELAADEHRVLVADLRGERVVAIDRATGASTVLAAAEPRPMSPALHHGRAIWLSCPYQLVPGAPSIGWTRLRVAVADDQVHTLASWSALPTWDAVATARGVAMVVRPTEKGRFRSHRVAALRRVGWDGAIDELAVLADPVLDDEHVRLVFHLDFYFTGRVHRELWTCAADGSHVRPLARLPGDPVALAADERGAVVIVRARETSGGSGDEHVILACSHDRAPIELGRYEAGAGHRPRVLADASGVFFTVGHEVVRAPRIRS